MLTQLGGLLRAMLSSVRDLTPIVAVIAFLSDRRAAASARGSRAKRSSGVLCVVAGLTFFIAGLEMALFPLGETMAGAFLEKGSLPALLAFAFRPGFLAPPWPSRRSSRSAWKRRGQRRRRGVVAASEAAQNDYALGLRLTVATAVGVAIVLGVFRILRGWPIHWLIIGGYVIVVVMTTFAPREIIGIAYDSGGVTTSTITVPMVTALGVGLASSIRGRNPIVDGFGLIAFASLTPMIFVMAYGMVLW